LPGENKDQRSPLLTLLLMHLLRLVLLLASGIFLAAGEDWPRFLGPRADGISRESGLLQRWDSNGPPVVFEKDIGPGYSAPSILDGLLVLHHRIKDEEVVEAFEAASGQPVWRYGYPSSFVDPYGYNNGPRCTPLLSQGKCFTFGAEGKLLCLELKTGRKIWERDTERDWNVPEAFFGVGSTPILEGNLLIVMVGGQPNSGVIAFDAQTGKTVWENVGKDTWEGQPMVGWPGERKVVWKHWDKQASYATPVAATINGERQVLCFMRQGLVSLNPVTGNVNFSFWFRAQVEESVNAANPLVVGNRVLISSAYYKVGAVLLEIPPGNKSAREVWRSQALEIHWTTPIFHDGYVYAFSGRNEPDARFRCVEFNTGKIMWERNEAWRRYGTGPNTYGRGSAILADGKLIVLGEAGLLGMFKANPHQEEEICRAQIPALKYPCWAAPILANKRLYVRSEDKLICFNLNPKPE
jgi:outer membrane protein assembly factor BamB